MGLGEVFLSKMRNLEIINFKNDQSYLKIKAFCTTEEKIHTIAMRKVQIKKPSCHLLA